MLAKGARVVIADFNSDMGQETVELIQQAGGEAAFVQGDVSEEESVKEAVDLLYQLMGRLDIACNSAAVSRGAGPIHEYEREVFDQTLEMCLTNTWLCMKYEIAAMLTNGWWRYRQYLVQFIPERPGLQHRLRRGKSRVLTFSPRALPPSTVPGEFASMWFLPV